MLLILNLFRIGFGPSSSHMVGLIRIARRFVASLAEARELGDVRRIGIELQDSLALTGVGPYHPYATSQMKSLVLETYRAVSTAFFAETGISRSDPATDMGNAATTTSRSASSSLLA